jgi:hypothetical protein
MRNARQCAAALFGVTALVLAAASATAPAAAPAAGDTFVYRLVNGYNRETLGRVEYVVEKADAAGVVFNVTPDNAQAGAARTEIYDREGNGLRHPIESHGVPVEYAFAAPLPSYVFPLDPGKRWSRRVRATVAHESRPRSVRVDGLVVGRERIRVPAGEFDVVKISRAVYPGDTGWFRTETHLVELDWYAPALGRSVRTERRSEWFDMSRCDEDLGCDVRGSWEVLELVEARPARR